MGRYSPGVVEQAPRPLDYSPISNALALVLEQRREARRDRRADQRYADERAYRTQRDAVLDAQAAAVNARADATADRENARLSIEAGREGYRPVGSVSDTATGTARAMAMAPGGFALPLDDAQARGVAGGMLAANAPRLTVGGRALYQDPTQTERAQSQRDAVARTLLDNTQTTARDAAAFRRQQELEGLRFSHDRALEGVRQAGARSLEQMRAAADLEKARLALQGKQEKAETLPPGMRATYTTNDNQLTTLSGLLNTYRQKLDARGPQMFVGPNSPEDNDLASSYQAVQMALKEANNLGVLSGPDLALLQKQIGEPFGIGAKIRGKAGLEAQVDAVGQTLRTKRSSLATSYGLPDPTATADAPPTATPVPAKDARTRARELQAAGKTRDQIAATMRAEGYDVH